MFGKFNVSKNGTFIFQVNDSFLKVVKCLPGGNLKIKPCDFYSEPLPAEISPENLAEKLSHAFHKLGYSHSPVIVSLPRAQATCRYLKIPSHNIREIEKIASLQAVRYLPYPANELVSGFEVVSTEAGGYSGVSQVIVHKEVIERYTAAFRKLKISAPRIILSSYSLCNLFAYSGKHKQTSSPAMVIDIDSGQAELVVTIGGKLLFSRSFHLNMAKSGWQDAFISETGKSLDAFIKETGRDMPSTIAITGNIKEAAELNGLLAARFNIPVEILDCGIGMTVDSGVSFSGLLGLGLGNISESLNLLSLGFKKEREKIKMQHQLQQVALFGCGFAVVFGLAVAKDIDNKSRHLSMLNKELNKLTNDTKALEGLDRKLKFLEGRLKNRPSVLAVLYEISQASPPNVFLSYFNYGEDNRLVLRGQADELGYVFNFVSRLEKSSLLKGFGLKVKYATKRKLQTREVVDFEIAGLSPAPV